MSIFTALAQRHANHEKRHMDLDDGVQVGLAEQAEGGMLRHEHALRHLRLHGHMPKDCVTCGEEIGEKRRIACPETLWCFDCTRAYDEKKGRRPWRLKLQKR